MARLGAAEPAVVARRVQRVATTSLSFFASRLAETPSAIAATTDAGPGNCTDGTLLRVRMLAAAAPTTMKHPSVRRIIVLVNRISAPFDKATNPIPKNGDLIVAWKSRATKNAMSIERNGGIQRRTTALSTHFARVQPRPYAANRSTAPESWQTIKPQRPVRRLPGYRRRYRRPPRPRPKRSIGP